MLAVRKTKDKGLGVFATKDIEKGAVVIRFEGEVMPHSQCPEEEDPYMLLLNGGYGVIPRNESRFVNHSCDPNCEVFGEYLVATKEIGPGEELTFDYCLLDEGDNYEWKDSWTFECRCGSPKCRKAVDRFFYKPEGKSEAAQP